MKRLTALILLVTLSYGGFSQKIEVDRADLVKKLKQLEDLKVKAIELDQCKIQVEQLVGVVAAKDARIFNYEEQARNYSGQITLKDETIKSLNKSLKSQKRKTIAVGTAAVLAVGAILFLNK